MEEAQLEYHLLSKVKKGIGYEGVASLHLLYYSVQEEVLNEVTPSSSGV